VAYDADLADRIRELLAADGHELNEVRMFGGLAFLIRGNMAVAASGQGGIMVRVDPDQSDKLAKGAGVDLLEMRGRRMKGWLRVAPEHLRSRRELSTWVDRGVGYARSLPPKNRNK
jgi:hypothetical protein